MEDGGIEYEGICKVIKYPGKYLLCVTSLNYNVINMLCIYTYLQYLGRQTV